MWVGVGAGLGLGLGAGPGGREMVRGSGGKKRRGRVQEAAGVGADSGGGRGTKRLRRGEKHVQAMLRTFSSRSGRRKAKGNRAHGCDKVRPARGDELGARASEGGRTVGDNATDRVALVVELEVHVLALHVPPRPHATVQCVRVARVEQALFDEREENVQSATSCRCASSWHCQRL